MAKKKWFQAAGLVLLCHLTISACQHQQAEKEAATAPSSSAQTNSSRSRQDAKKGKKATTETPSKTEAGIPGVTVPTSDGFILTDQSKILTHTKDGIVVDHDGHSHFIFYTDLQGTKFAHLIPSGANLTQPSRPTQAAGESQSQQATGDDHHYTFNPADIVAEDALGYTVRHGDHYHYILKSSLASQPVVTVSGANSGAGSPALVTPTAAQSGATSGQGIAGIDYPTSDGFLFDGTGMSGWTDIGLLVNHNGHLHLILKTDLAQSKWAHLLASQPSQPVTVTQPSQPSLPSQPTVSVTPAQPNQPTVPIAPAIPTGDDVALKRAYLAAATGLAESQIVLLDTPNGQAFMYPHGDHHHVVLLSSLDITKPYDDGHGNHGQDDHSNHQHDDHSGEHTGDDHHHDDHADDSDSGDQHGDNIADTDNHGEQTDTGDTHNHDEEQPAQPTTPVAPATPTGDDMALKRAYLATATGLAESQIVLLDTPNGQAFMYPHGDHHHVVLLSSLDITKPYDDGHGNQGQDSHGQDDHSDHHHDDHSGDTDSGEHTGDDHHHDDHVDDSDSGDQHGDNIADTDNHGEQPDTGDTHNHGDSADDVNSGEQSGDNSADTDNQGTQTDTGETHKHDDHTDGSNSDEQAGNNPADTGDTHNHGESQPSQPTAPIAPATPTGDDVALKRAYLAAATGLSENQVVLLDTPNGQAFMYPHGDHHHVVLLSSLDITKPYDDGHGNHGQDDHSDHQHDDHSGEHTGDDHHHDDHGDDGDSGDQHSDNIADTDNQGKQPDTGDAHNHDDHSGDTNSDEEPGDNSADTDNQGEQPDTGDTNEQPAQPTPPVAPATPTVDDVALKRAYLAAATGLAESQIVLLDTPNGQAFMYPHGDHHHVVLLSSLDITKPYDDGHGNHGQDDHSDHHHDDHVDDGDSGDQHGDNLADTGNQGNQTDTGDTHKHGDHADGSNSDGQSGNNPADTGNQGEQAGDGQTDTDNRDEQDGDMTGGQDGTNHQDQPGVGTPGGTDQADGGGSDTVGQPVADQPSDSTQPTEPTPPKTGFPGIDYPTSDGFLFDGTGMAGWTSAGLLVDHNGHLHILPTEAIAQSKWAHLLPNDKPGTATAPVELSEKLTKQREDLAKQLGLKTEDIRVITADGKVVAFEYPHEDHTHLVPVTDDETPKNSLTDEEKRELTAYIRKTYGLLLGTPVTFHEDFVVFAIPHPHQDYDANRDYYSDVLDPAYDPGHVHPYAVPLSTLSIPKTTDIPELDFENELILAAKRIGVAPSEVKIKDKKYFVLPGKDHDHYLNILTPVAGLDAYMANKLPDIKANFVVGDYSKEAVVAEADRILAAAKDKFGDGTVEFRRVARALEAFKANLTVATTSTEGYVKALQSFENKHLKGLTEDTAEVTEVTDPVVATYLSLTDRLKGYDERTLKNFGLNAEQKVAELKRLVAAKDEAGLARVVTHFNAIDRVKRAANDLGPRLAYMDFFVRNVDSDKLPASLRQEVLDKLMELQKISGLYRNPQKFMAGLESTALLKERVKVALAAEGPAPDHANWTPYPRGYDRREIVREINSMRDFVIKHKEVTAEELAEGFNKPLELFKDLPKKPTQPVTPPKPVEEAPKPTAPTQPTTGTTDPAPTQPTTPEQPAETPAVSLEEQHAGIKTWLDGLTASLLRRYTIDRDAWSGDLETALTNDDAAEMAKFQAYMDAIVRVEKQNNINASRTAHVDYFLRHIDQAYLDNSLREQVAEQLVKIYAATTYDYKKVLVETVALKAAVKAAIVANQTHDVAHGDAYHAFLEKKEDMVTSVEQRKAFLIKQGSLTKQELAEGFGQPYPAP